MIVNLLKPPGLSSNTAVNIVKYIYGAKKAGHTGTLDPGASGVLAVCLNESTKLAESLMDSPKTYIAETYFGISTDTQDSYGKVLECCEVNVSAEDITGILPDFLGDIQQITPNFSAVKQNGVPQYVLARKGKEIIPKPREVTIHSITLLSQTAPNRFLMEVSCSKGTYIRTLCEDMGKKLGIPAHMSFLLRTQTSGLTIENAKTFSELREEQCK